MDTTSINLRIAIAYSNHQCTIGVDESVVLRIIFFSFSSLPERLMSKCYKASRYCCFPGGEWGVGAGLVSMNPKDCSVLLILSMAICSG